MTLEMTPITPRYGVRIDNLDLRDLTDDTFADLRDAFERNSLLFLPGQEITDEDHIALAKRFEPLEDRNADNLAADETFKVPEVSNIRADGSVTGEMDLHMLELKANMQCTRTARSCPSQSSATF